MSDDVITLLFVRSCALITEFEIGSVMTDNEPTDSEVRSYVAYAASADENSNLLGMDPIEHAREKARQANCVLTKMGVRQPQARPLFHRSALAGAIPQSRPDAELQALAGPRFLIWLSPTDLASFDQFALAFKEQSGMRVRLDPLLHLGESPEQGWLRVAKALRWLALTDTDLLLLNQG